MTKKDKIKKFDANGIGQLNDGMFGLPFNLDECETVLIPVIPKRTVSVKTALLGHGFYLTFILLKSMEHESK